MAKKKTKKPIPKLPKQKRTFRSSFMLTDEENSAIEHYCKKYKVNNKARFMRESVLRTVMEKLLDDYPTLFEKEDMDDLIV